MSTPCFLLRHLAHAPFTLKECPYVSQSNGSVSLQSPFCLCGSAKLFIGAFDVYLSVSTH